MKIPVNKNIDVYKDDFFKGLSMRECLCASHGRIWHGCIFS